MPKLIELGAAEDPNGERQTEPPRTEDAHAAAGLLIGPAGGLLVTLASHVVWLGFDGWTWRFLPLAILAGGLAGAAGMHLGTADLAWSRKVQRGRLTLKRLRARKTLCGVSAL